MWVKLVVGSVLCSERFFSGFSSFPLFPIINISKFQFDQMQHLRESLFCISGASWVNIINLYYATESIKDYQKSVISIVSFFVLRLFD